MAGGKYSFLIFFGTLFFGVFGQAHLDCDNVLRFPKPYVSEIIESTAGMNFNGFLRELKRNYVLGQARQNGSANLKSSAVLEYTAEGYAIIIGSSLEISVPDVTTRENYFRQKGEKVIYGQLVELPPSRFREEIKFEVDPLSGAKSLIVTREDLNGHVAREMYKISLTNKVLNP